MNLKDLLFLVAYSIKDILLDVLRVLEILKKPQTWSFVMYVSLFLIAYYQKLTKVNAAVLLSLILVIYVVRQHKDPEFNRAVKDKAFLKNDDLKVMKYYEDYKKRCYFSVPRKEPLSYEEYQQKEVEEIKERKKESTS